MSALPTPPLHWEEPPRLPERRARWKRVVAWTTAVLAILILLVFLGVVVLLNNGRARQWLLAQAEQRVEQSLGANVQVRDFRVTWSGVSPKVEMYDVVIAGAPPYASPPLAQADRIVLGVTITSLLHRNFYVKEARLEHPVVRVFVDKRGRDNLPKPESSGGQSQTNLFDLGVRHAAIERGEIYYNDRKSALDADLHDLEFRAAYDTSNRAYNGTLSYRDGHLRYGAYRPVPHSLDATWSASPQAFKLDRALLSAGNSRLDLQATLSDYSSPHLQATYDAMVDAGQLRGILRNPSLPSGLVRARGELSYKSAPNRPAIETVVVRGDIASAALAVRSPSFRGDIRDLAARYTVANGNAEVRDLRARLLGGELSGSLTLRNLAGNTRSNLRAALRGVSLAQLKPMVQSPALKQVNLGGTANVNADAAWGKSMDDLVARADANLQAHVSPAAGGAAVPVSSVVHARYATPAKTITLSQSYLRLPQTSLTLDGTVSQRSALRVNLQSRDLHELESLAELFRAPGQPAPQPLDLAGTASFTGQVTGSTAAPRVTGLLTASNLRVKNSAWSLVRTNVDLSPARAALQNGLAQALPRGSIRFDLAAGLRKWSFEKTSPFEARVNARQLDVASLARIAGSAAPVRGTLAINVAASGSQLSPRGTGTVRLSNAVVSGQPLRSVNLEFQGTGSQVNANLQASLPAGSANATFTYLPQQETFQAQLRAIGIKLQELQAVKDRSLDLKGELNLTASGSGNIRNPQLQAKLAIPQLQMSGQTISRINLNAAFANRVANFNLDSAVVNTFVRARGTVNLTGDYFADAVLDTQSIPLAPLVAAYAPSQAGNVAGQTELHATLRGPLKNQSALEAHLAIPTLQVNYKNTVHLAAAGPIRADYTNGVLQLQRSAIRGTGTDLQFQGTVPIADRSRPMSALLLGTVDLKLAQLFQPDLASSGQLQFDINSYGQRSDPNVQGQIRIVNANFASGNVPIGLQNGNGVLTLTEDRLQITQFRGTVGGGDLTATGAVVYRPTMHFDLALAGKSIRLLYQNSIRAALDTNLAFTGTPQFARLHGNVNVDQLQFTPGFDLMDFMGSLGGGATTPPPSQSFSDNVRLDVGVTSGGGVQLVSRTLSLNAAANLRVAGTASQPVILGRINVNGGDLIFMGNRYVLQGGTVDFVNASQTQPVVNLNVNTTIDQYNIQMRFWGPADHLHTSYASDPALPPSDIINLVAFGKTVEASAANPTPPGTLGAESVVASQVSSQITSRVEKIAGISQLSVDPVLGGGSQQTPGARVTIQQRVTSKIFVTFSTDVTSTQRNAVKFEYQITPRKSVNITRDQNGGLSFDTRFRKSW